MNTFSCDSRFDVLASASGASLNMLLDDSQKLGKRSSPQ